jgi:hypothetical protein
MRKQLQRSGKARTTPSVTNPNFVSMFRSLSEVGQQLLPDVPLHPSADAFGMSVTGIPFADKAAAAQAEANGTPREAAQRHLYDNMVRPATDAQFQARQQRAAIEAYEYADLVPPPNPKLPNNPLFVRHSAKYTDIPAAIRNGSLKGGERVAIEKIAVATASLGEKLLHLGQVERSNEANHYDHFCAQYEKIEGKSNRINSLVSEVERLNQLTIHLHATAVQQIISFNAIVTDAMLIPSARAAAVQDINSLSRQYDAFIFSSATNAPHQAGFSHDNPYAKKEKKDKSDSKSSKKDKKPEVSRRRSHLAGGNARNTANTSDDEDTHDHHRSRERGSRGHGGKGRKHRAAHSDPKDPNASAKPANPPNAKPMHERDGSGSKRASPKHASGGKSSQGKRTEADSDPKRRSHEHSGKAKRHKSRGKSDS